MSRNLPRFLLTVTAIGVPAAAVALTAQPRERALMLPRATPHAAVAEHAMIAAAHPLAVEAGLEMLRAGGNAIDALVAVQAALAVVEPESSGIGGGSFILFHDTKANRTTFLDGREEVPAGSRRADFLAPDGGVRPDAQLGGACVGVPGTVAVMWQAHSRWGKLPISQVLAPAVRLAEQGVGVTPRLRDSIASQADRLKKFPASKAAFLHPDGSAPDLGEVLKQPDLARTLRLLAEQGPKAFYEGDIAADVVKAVRESAAHPGRMSLDDLRNYRALERPPVRFRYRGHELVGAAPPSSGAITLGLILGVLEPAEERVAPPGSLEEADFLARAGAVAFADRNAYLGDPDASPTLDMRALLEPNRLAGRRAAAKALKPGTRAEPGPRPGPPATSGGAGNAAAGEGHEGQHTSHISVVDAEHNFVACTTTIEGVVGSAVVVPGRGFVLNNQLTDFDLNRATGPNALDPRRVRRGPDNLPSGKRPRSSMTPTILLKDGQPVMTVGSPGGPYIIGIVAQIIHNVLDQGLDMQQAITAPRLSAQNRPLELEAHYPDRVKLSRELGERGWSVRRNTVDWHERVFGNAQGIRVRSDGKLEGGSDPRGEGVARGY
jgi:gamma-glutamyltranspeptidase/glutathione hydrolase